MPTTRRSRTIAAPAQQIWELVSDPHHLPRWWPRVERVEDVVDESFTEVMRTRKGKVVRADFSLVLGNGEEQRLTWAQRVQGTPFAAVLRSAETEVSLRPKGQGTEVTIELRQEMATRATHNLLFAFAPRLGAPMVRRAAAATIEEALDGLERVSV